MREELVFITCSYIFKFRGELFKEVWLMAQLESKFQSKLIKEIKEQLEGSIVVKLDANYIQGIPDLAIFYKDKWATLECKRSKTAKHRPNQKYYVEKMNNMSFSRTIYPENKEEVLNELYRTFES